MPKPENLSQEHNYYGKSTLHFLSADRPERLVYFCLHQEETYLAAQAQAIKRFEESTIACRAADKVTLLNRDALTDDQKQILTNLVEKHIQGIIGTLQVESGSYRLSIAIEYESTGARFRRLRRPKKSSSSILFTFPIAFRSDIEMQTKIALATRAAFLLYGINDTLQWPTFSPIGFKEP